MSSTQKLVVGERCGFIALLPETVGWQMQTLEKGLCPASVKETATSDRARQPRTSTAH
jgi:hypothetical protein